MRRSQGQGNEALTRQRGLASSPLDTGNDRETTWELWLEKMLPVSKFKDSFNSKRVYN